MSKCGNVNRLLMMRNRGLGGPLMQNIGGGVCAKSVGSYLSPNGPGYGPKYLLDANFDVENTSFADGDIIENVAPDAVQEGSLVVREGTASISINSNKLRIANSAETWDQGNVCSITPVPIALGNALFAKMNNPSIEGGSFDQSNIGLVNSNGAFSGSTTWEFMASMDWVANGGQVAFNMPNSGGTIKQYEAVKFQTYTTGIDYEFCLILGGFSSTREHYKDGDTAADYDYGAFLFVKGGTQFPYWELVYSSDDYKPSAANLYLGIGVYDMTLDVNDVKATEGDFKSVIAPVVLDNFNDTDGTLLTSHTPDIAPVGSSWTFHGSTEIEIQSNHAERKTANPDRAYAYIESNTADCFISLIDQGYADSGLTYEYAGLVFRYTDTSNFYFTYYNFYAGEYTLYDVTGDTWVKRFATSASIVFIPNVYVRQTIRLDGNDMVFFVYDGTDKKRFTYSSSTRNAETNHGFCYTKRNTPTGKAKSKCFTIHALGKNNEYTALDGWDT